MESQQLPVDIPKTILKYNKLQNQDLLSSKYDYQNVGTNGFIEVEPDIVKFSGFEIQKTNILSVKILNSSAISQRIHILPPSTKFFEIKIKKKGFLAPGMSEELQILFKPQEHKYYYDSIKIHTENDNLLIPVHGYPILNREQFKSTFPQLIDFGSVEIGTSAQFVFPLSCKIPLNFEYEFEFNIEHPDITIEPMEGVIPGNGQADIQVDFNPTQNITLIVEAQLKISQFDFKPLIIKIIGSGRH